jgi:hypothetical protein
MYVLIVSIIVIPVVTLAAIAFRRLDRRIVASRLDQLSLPVGRSCRTYETAYQPAFVADDDGLGDSSSSRFCVGECR